MRYNAIYWIRVLLVIFKVFKELRVVNAARAFVNNKNI